MDIKKIGEQLTELRKRKGLTQSELAERIGVSFQAVSKWERGESLPDISLLTDLSRILEVSVDYILLSGENTVAYKGRVSVSDLIEGLNCIKKAGEYLGKDNIIYQAAIIGINNSMNTDIEKAFTDDYTFEAFLTEAIIQNLISGRYIDISDIKHNFRTEHFKNIAVSFCSEYGIK